MATSPGFVRAALPASRALTESIIDALREAVIVVDARARNLPLRLANSSARRCLLGDEAPLLVADSSLYAFLGGKADAVIQAALTGAAMDTPTSSRMLSWRFSLGEIPVLTQITVLESNPSQQLVMLAFAESVSDAAAEAKRVTDVGDAAPDLLILDRELTVTYASLGAVRTAGSLDGEPASATAGAPGVLGFSALILAPTSAVPREAFVGALEGRRFADDAIAVKSPGAPTRWFQVDIQPLRDGTGVVGLAVLSLELSEAAVRSRAIRGGDRRLSVLTENASDIIKIASRDGDLQYVSGGVRNALGYSPEDRRSTSLFGLVHPEDLDALRTRYSELVAGLIESFTHEYRLRHRDGTYRWFEASYVSALGSPLIDGVVINARDVTERRLAETRLAQREEVFRLAAEAVNGVLFEWDLVLGSVQCSRGALDLMGMDPSELQSVAAWEDRVHPLDLPGLNQTIQAALESEAGWTAQYRIRNSEGRYLPVLERARIQRDASARPVRAVGCSMDVSEVHRLTDLLNETQRSAKTGGWEYRFDTRALEWTEGMYRIFDARPDAFEVTWHSMMGRCTPESRQRLYEAIDRAEADDTPINVELEVLTLRDQRLWVRVVGHLEKQNGRPVRAYGSMQNIQAQKVAQLSLQQTTDWLKMSMTMAHMHAWRWDRGTDSLEFAILDGSMVHLPRVFPGMKKLLSRVHPGDRLAVRRCMDAAFDRHDDVHLQFRLRSHDGQYRTYAAVARPLFDATNQPVGLVGITQDVTPRHEAAARLRRSKELLRTTTAYTADTLILLDAELRIRFINRPVCGVGVAVLVGHPIGVLLPEAVRESVLARLALVLETGEAVTFEYESKGAGPVETYETTAVRVSDALHPSVSITMRNITERKRLEEEILNISSRERQSIGRDLHDGLGQELTGVALMLRALSTKMRGSAPESAAQVEEIAGVVRQSIETARGLARGLLPVNTDGGGLVSALKALADRCRDVYGFNATFEADVTAALALNETKANHVYRIAQEALSNAARHGNPRSVSITLEVTDAYFLLCIADDGTGLPPAAQSGPGMGLRIMKYRASMIHAKFEVVPNLPCGTIVRVVGQRAATADSATTDSSGDTSEL
jgi:PAS domain S-box-containing protein